MHPLCRSCTPPLLAPPHHLCSLLHTTSLCCLHTPPHTASASHLWKLLHATPACHLSMLLHAPSPCPFCMLPLHATSAGSPLHATSAHHLCMPPLQAPMVTISILL